MAAGIITIAAIEFTVVGGHTLQTCNAYCRITCSEKVLDVACRGASRLARSLFITR
jgi:hypothetical protein